MKKYIFILLFVYTASLLTMQSSESSELLITEEKAPVVSLEIIQPKSFNNQDFLQHLKEAARAKKFTFVQTAVNKGFDVNTSVDLENTTLLMIAARENDLQTAQFLYSHGALVNARTHKNWTALMFAARNGHKTMAKLLLLHGADKNMRNSIGEQPHQIAHRFNHRKLAWELLPWYIKLIKNITL